MNENWSWWFSSQGEKENLDKVGSGNSELDEKAKQVFRILIVEDESVTRETLGKILKEEGYDVITTEDGFKAIEKVNEVPFNFVLMDIKLPGMNGVEALKVIKKINPAIKVVMITAYPVQGLIKEALQEGAYTCIYKPFEVQDILNIINKIRG